MSTSPTPRYTRGTSDKLNYKETKEVINKLYTDTSPHKDSQGKSDNKKEDIKHQEGDNLKLNLTPDNSFCQNPDGKFPDIMYQERKELLSKLYNDTTPSYKDNNSTSHSHKYIKHDSTVNVQDPLTSHYPPGQDKKQECGYPLHNLDKFMEKENLCPLSYCQIALLCKKTIMYHDTVQSSDPQQVSTVSHDNKCMVKDNIMDLVPDKENIKMDPDKVRTKKIVDETMGDEVKIFFIILSYFSNAIVIIYYILNRMSHQNHFSNQLIN